MGLEVLEVVLEREAPLEDRGVEWLLDLELAVLSHLEGRRVYTGRHGPAERTGHREGLHQVELIRQIPKTLAEEKPGRPRVEALRVDLLAPGAADIPAQIDRRQELVRGVLEEDVLRRDLQIVEATHRLPRLRIQHREGSAER